MITLATLAEATPQEVFDQGAKHLMEQGCKARSEEYPCVYRGDKGTKCIVGCFISDEEYNPLMENTMFYSLWGNRQDTPGSDMLGKMQYIHDDHPPEQWKDKLTQFAEDNGLSMEVLK